MLRVHLFMVGILKLLLALMIQLRNRLHFMQQPNDLMSELHIPIIIFMVLIQQV